MNRIKLIAIVAAAIPLAACGVASPTVAGTPTPSGPAAPKVPKALNVSKWVDDPCSTLTKAEAKSAIVVAPDRVEKLSTAGGPGCTWSNLDTGAVFGITWLSTNGETLAAQYRDNAKMHWPYFEPTTISGYPAAFGDPHGDARKDGDCSVTVAVKDDLAFISQMQGGGGNACQDAKKAAEIVVNKAKGA